MSSLSIRIESQTEETASLLNHQTNNDSSRPEIEQMGKKPSSREEIRVKRQHLGYSSKIEILLCYAINIYYVYFIITNVANISEKALNPARFRHLTKGWFLERNVDLTDTQWRIFRDNLPLQIIGALIFLIISYIVRKLIKLCFNSDTLEQDMKGNSNDNINDDDTRRRDNSRSDINTGTIEDCSSNGRLSIHRATNVMCLFYLIVSLLVEIYLYGTGVGFMLFVLLINYFIGDFIYSNIFDKYILSYIFGNSINNSKNSKNRKNASKTFLIWVYNLTICYFILQYSESDFFTYENIFTNIFGLFNKRSTRWFDALLSKQIHWKDTYRFMLLKSISYQMDRNHYHRTLLNNPNPNTKNNNRTNNNGNSNTNINTSDTNSSLLGDSNNNNIGESNSSQNRNRNRFGTSSSSAAAILASGRKQEESKIIKNKMYDSQFHLNYLNFNYDYNLISYFSYMLYYPLHIAGPIISFHDWMAQVKSNFCNENPYKKNNGDVSPLTLNYKLVYFTRYVICYLCNEIMLHYCYTHCLSRFGYPMKSSLDTYLKYLDSHPNSSNEMPFNMDMINKHLGEYIVGLGCFSYLHLNSIWLKFLLIWRFTRFWALLDGIVTVENMQRCITNSDSIVDFWKYWHSSFNLWNKRYIFIPLSNVFIKNENKNKDVNKKQGANKNANNLDKIDESGNEKKVGNFEKFRKIFENSKFRTYCVIILIFAFTAVWHGDFNLSLIMWGAMMALAMIPEIAISGWFWQSKIGIVKYCRNNVRISRYIAAFGGAINIFILIFANEVGYGPGWDTMKHLFAMMISSWNGFLVIFYSMLWFMVAVMCMFHLRYLEHYNIVNPLATLAKLRSRFADSHHRQ